MLVVVNLDPGSPQESIVRLDLASLGLGDRVRAYDEVSGATWEWGQDNYVRLDPSIAVAHILSLSCI